MECLVIHFQLVPGRRASAKNVVVRRPRQALFAVDLGIVSIHLEGDEPSPRRSIESRPVGRERRRGRQEHRTRDGGAAPPPQDRDEPEKSQRAGAASRRTPASARGRASRVPVVVVEVVDLHRCPRRRRGEVGVVPVRVCRSDEQVVWLAIPQRRSEAVVIDVRMGRHEVVGRRARDVDRGPLRNREHVVGPRPQPG